MEVIYMSIAAILMVAVLLIIFVPIVRKKKLKEYSQSNKVLIESLVKESEYRKLKT